MGIENRGIPRLVPGRDYELQYKNKNGREYAVLKMKSGDWKIEGDDDFIRIYHHNTQMFGFDVNGFNSLLNLVLGFVQATDQIREDRNKSPEGEPVQN